MKLIKNIIDSRVDQVKIISDATHWVFDSGFNLEQEILIGMSPTNYHCFIVSGQVEFHPRFSFNDARIVRSHPRRIRAGVFIRLKNISPEKIQVFQHYLSQLNGARSRSCHMGTLRALYEGLGIYIDGLKNKNIAPSELLTGVINSGLVQENNEALDFEIYIVKNKKIHEIISEVKYFQRKFKWAYIISDLYYNILAVTGLRAIL